MTRGPNWLFLDLGRRLERALHLAWLVRQTVADTDARETEHMRILLEIADSAMTYRSRYLNVFQLVPFVDLLLLDEHNPRSCAFQLAAIESHLRELPRITLAQRSDVPRTIAQEMRAAAGQCQSRAAGLLRRRRPRPALIELTDAIIASAGESVGRPRRRLFPACQPQPHRRQPHAGGVMEYLVRHRTTYRYLQDVSHSWHLAHLRPRSTPHQSVHDSNITLEPGARHAGWGARIISAIPANGFPSTSRTPSWKWWRKAA